VLIYAFTRMVQVYLAHLPACRPRSLVIQHGGAAHDWRAGGTRDG
jgi:hypothetical protein